MKVLWEGDFFVSHSLARSNRDVCRALVAANVDLSIKQVLRPGEPDARITWVGKAINPALVRDYADLARINEPDGCEADVVVRYQYPVNRAKPTSGKWVLYQPWEVGGMPKAWEEVIQGADAFWGPSSYVREVFQRNLAAAGRGGAPTALVPNAVDIDLFKPYTGKTDVIPAETSGMLVFLYVGGLIHRKGFDVALSAFYNAFRGRQDAVLVVKGCGSDSYYRHNTQKALIDQIKEKADCPPILYNEQHLSDQQMVELYSKATALVAPYRGEGFCLPALESLACGTPVVVTSGGPTDDFFTTGCGVQLPASKVTQEGDCGLGETYVPVTLLEPAMESLCSSLQQIAAKKDTWKKDRMDTCVRAASRFTPEDSARAAIEALERLLQQN